ncbi:MAG: fructose-6-phosphate aldolase [Bacillota bacterium]|nr:fructose-6-phosphate aldolase [Bacillota bacterium]
MELFLDTANIDDIRKAVEIGVISGVTTNPSLVAKEKRDFHSVVKEICAIVPGPVSAEVLSLEAPKMIEEARVLAALAPNVVVKLPMTREGLKACKVLTGEGIKTNVTLVFSANQALLAALAGATYVSPFVGRLDDAGNEGMQVVRDIVQIYENYDIATRVITASVRHPMHVIEAAKAGSDIATVPTAVLDAMFRHPLTDTGVERFLADWKKVTG